MSRHARTAASPAATTAPAPWLADLLRERADAAAGAPGRHAAPVDLMDAPTVPFARLRAGLAGEALPAPLAPAAAVAGPAGWFGRRSKAVRIGVPAAVGTAAVLCLVPFLGHDRPAPAASSAAAPSAGKTVSVVVDGHLQTVSTQAHTVSDVLAAAHIAPGLHDTVSPGPAAAVADGALIVIDRGRPLTLTIDGRQQTAWTSAHTVRAALEELGVRAASGGQLHLSVSPAAAIPLSGASVSATTMNAVALRIGGAPAVQRSSAARTVKAVLAEQKITLGAQDRVSPGLHTAITPGLVITVDRVRTSTVSHARAVAQPADVQVSDDALDQGTREVARAGSPGQEMVTDQVTSVNGATTGTRQVGVRTVSSPVAAVVHVGTRTPDPGSEAAAVEAASHFTYDGDQVLTHDTTFGVNWDGLSMCESTHNPRAVNANPSAGLPTYGLFQFDLPTWESVGGSGNPMDATPQEQLMRAKLLYEQRNLEPWACGYAAH